ncbi:MAG: bifunctional (p)ppGpp synthetase/guanosine-3',5'-bis(diphosphate) 3'-pyrophosphohydrolase [Betaproteobacteria bacterium]|nr:bifunctional (p)ppGpp synthetase/guanosine-3',5'-bis(diphosphate) 3'-pyrophosphohydrolase [Betaproteobacteria bacterium]MDE2131991.1 bifunctional (p)ppGpp synthetase/guanosine-3',5'-bis(diphosphate) 3'-pyrophosphohydrolase [Betaproteobacteria bacterium]MDE2212238.1 bifunctional (p)ppGpp synthetase/guanosine-3',5'-bis(diphosphate) 3'-pyrophosphohydrolase [Betaproteobacteria bacterium]
MVSRTSHSDTFDADHGLAGLGLNERYLQPDAALIEQAFARVTEREGGTDAEAEALQRGLTTARLLSDLEAHPACIVVALLRALSWEQLERMDLAQTFDPDVAAIARDMHRIDVTLPSILPSGSRLARDAQRMEGVRKLLLAMAQDIRVVIVALAERVWLMRVISQRDPVEQLAVAHQTMDLYAPLANRLGVWHLKWELEDLSFRIIEPDTYKAIAKRLDERLVDRERYIEGLIRMLEQQLAANGIAGQVQGRPKHIYSIVKKMRSKNLDFEGLYDVRAVRVIVDDVRDCYAVLGIVHNLWSPVSGEFDDYIARPKGNNYRSLHTAVIGPEGKAVEIQIRTREMHRDSELGIASHWRYKEGGARTDRRFDERVAWLRQMLEWQKEVAHAATPGAVPAPVDDVIYVFTPQGRIIDLPLGATPVDFAYHVHTDLGHRCRGAKVDGAIVPLNQPLQNAQRVEIITVRQGGPSRDWLNPEYGYLKSPRALAKVRQWFKQQHLEEDMAQGRIVLEKTLARLGKGQTNVERLAAHSGFSRVEDFLVALARGDISQRQIELLLDPLAQSAETETPPAVRPAHETGGEGILVLGVTNIATFMAKCCKPVPPEPIVGFVTRGRGVSIHRTNCRSLAALTTNQWQRMIPASWGKTTHGVFSVDLAVDAVDRKGLLRDISETLTREHINVTAVNTQSRGDRARMRFTVQIDSLDQLARALKALQGISGVEAAYRQ